MSQEQHDTGASPDEDESAPLGVSDEELPEDLQPSDDNPLAQPPDEDAPDDASEEDGPNH
jgi:hypothetical protein